MIRFEAKYRSFLRYGLAVVVVGAALALTLAVPQMLLPNPYVFFVLAVLISAWYGGIWAGLLTDLLSVVIMRHYHLYLPSMTDFLAADVGRFVIFAVIAAVISALLARHRQTLAALRRSHDQLEIYLRDMADGVVVQDRSGQVVYANYEAARLLGFVSTEALIAASRDDLLKDFELFDEMGEPLPPSSLPGRLALLGLRYPETVLRYHVKDSTRERWAYDKARPIFDQAGQVQYSVSLFLDITELKEAQQALAEQCEQMHERVRRQEAVARLGLSALAGTDLDALILEAVATLAQTLYTEYSKVLELLPNGTGLLLRAGSGWEAGVVGQTVLETGRDSQGGFTLLTNEPVIVTDLRTETRFNAPALLTSHGVISGMSVIIAGEARPWGVLGVHTTKKRSFTQDDVNFLQAIANLLASALSREQVRQAEHEERRFAEALQDTAAALSTAPDLAQVLDRLLVNAARAIPHDAATIMLIEDGFAQVVCRSGAAASAGTELPDACLPLPETAVLRQMAATSQPLIVDDTRRFAGWVELPGLAEQRAYAGAPLVARGEVVGFLNLSSAQPNAFAPEQSRRVQAFAAQATAALQCAQRYGADFQPAAGITIPALAQELRQRSP